MQMDNQVAMMLKGMYDVTVIPPADNISLSSYHVQQLMSEIGEVLDADKRWKNFRNDKYDKEAKAEELADCFIVLMNICMFSGFTSDEIEEAILSKIDKVSKRISESK